MNYPRKPLIALLAHFISPGLGYFYNGLFKKGIIISLSIWLGGSFLLRISGISNSFIGLVMLTVIFLTAQLYFMYDSYKTAKRLQVYELKAYNKWYFYLLFFLFNTACFEVIPKLSGNLGIGTQFFNIPESSSSMEPSIKVGDRIVVNYSTPADEMGVGDIVAFLPVGEKYPWISRIVAKQGDVFELKDDFIILNGRLSKVEKIKQFDSDEYLGDVISEYTETFPNGKKISIYKRSMGDTTASNIPPIIIPKDSVLLISDNRDNAQDGRFLGFTHKNRVVGKVLYTWWGKSKKRINIDLTKR